MKEFPGLQRPSIDYYVFRSLPYQQFVVCDLLYALLNQLLALPTCSEDIQVVHHKSRFWLSDITAAYQGNPAHPLTQALQKQLKTTDLPLKNWVNILTATEMDADQLLLENQEEFQVYAQKLYGNFFELLALALGYPSSDTRSLAQARTLLMMIQSPYRKGVRFHLSDTATSQICQGFQEAGKMDCPPLALLARVYRYQAEEPMVHLAPLKTLWLSIRERLYPSS